MLVDLIKYFFPIVNRDVALKCFKRLEATTPYMELKEFAETLPKEGLLPDITDMVIAGHDEENLSKNINSIDGYFLMIEYGILKGSAPNSAHVRDIEFSMTLFIGHKSNSSNLDAIQELLIMENCNNKIIEIIKKMEKDNKDLHPGLLFNESSFNVLPINPYGLFGATGWQLSFSKKENLIF